MNIFLGIIGITLGIYFVIVGIKDYKKEYPFYYTLQGVLAGLGFMVIGILTIIDYFKN